MPDRIPPREYSKRRVVAVALEGFAPLELALVISVLTSRRPSGDPLYAFAICGLGPDSVRGADGFTLTGVRSLRVLDDADIVIVPGSTRMDSADHQALLDALRRAHDRGATLVAIRSGVIMLANAGVQKVQAGHGCVITCASSIEAIEYCLRVVRSDWGDVVAEELAQDLFGAARLVGQARLSESQRSETSADAFARTLDWMRTNMHRPMTIGVVAARACMSKRHFMRRFLEQTGMTPMQWLLHRRLLAAQDLLVSSDLPLKQIAARVGFPSVRALRDQFKQRTGTSAMAYREEHRRRS